MQRSDTLSLECPHCNTRCQFKEIETSLRHSTIRNVSGNAYACTHCQGIVSALWDKNAGTMLAYFPSVANWKPKVKLPSIKHDKVREDFQEAIACYNHGLFNACMIMARRAIQQEVIINESKGENLYQQIESMGISNRLKTLLKKVKNFGNFGAHPDFLLFDGDGEKIDDKKEFAKLSLEFLDRYFSDQYEIDELIESAPKSEQELGAKGS